MAKFIDMSRQHQESVDKKFDEVCRTLKNLSIDVKKIEGRLDRMDLEIHERDDFIKAVMERFCDTDAKVNEHEEAINILDEVVDKVRQKQKNISADREKLREELIKVQRDTDAKHEKLIHVATTTDEIQSEVVDSLDKIREDIKLIRKAIDALERSKTFNYNEICGLKKRYDELYFSVRKINESAGVREYAQPPSIFPY
jgi:chromosome segregation ATPase